MRARLDLRAEAIRLRRDDRLSISEIQARIGGSQGSLSCWLREHPLTDEEVRSKQVAPPPALRKIRGDESSLHRVTRSHNPTSSHLGRVAEAAVLLRLLAHGFSVYGSPFDGDKADWVVDTGVRLLRLQVKMASEVKEGLPIVSLRRAQGRQRYSTGEFDFLVGFDLFTDTAYVWSEHEVAAHLTTISICPEAEERWDKLKS